MIIKIREWWTPERIELTAVLKIRSEYIFNFYSLTDSVVVLFSAAKNTFLIKMIPSVYLSYSFFHSINY